MNDIDSFKYIILSVAGLIIVALLVGFAYGCKELRKKTDFLKRVASSSPGQVSAWFEQHDTEIGYVPYTATVLYIHIKGDAELRTFETDDIKGAVDTLLRAGIAIQNPMPVVDKVKQRIAAESSKSSRV